MCGDVYTVIKCKKVSLCVGGAWRHVAALYQTIDMDIVGIEPMFTFQTSFKPLLLNWVGGGGEVALTHLQAYRPLLLSGWFWTLKLLSHKFWDYFE